VARAFRDFDFQLGRRNCQWFLRTSFAVDGDNPIVSNWGPKVERERFRARGDAAGPPSYVLVPLYGSADVEVILPEWPRITETEFDTLEQRIGERFDAVAPALIQQNVGGLLGILFQIALLPGLNVFLSLIRDKVLRYIRLTILADLVRRDQIAGWDLPIDTGLAPDDLRLVLGELLIPSFDLRTAAGIFKSIRPIAAPGLTIAGVDAALQRLKTAEGKPHQVWQAGWDGPVDADGKAARLYAMASRKPGWADPWTGGRYLARALQPSVD
jgi:hypothetical protein